MIVLKRILKIGLRAVLTIVGFLALYFIAAVVLGLIPVNSDYQAPEEGIDIFLMVTAVHVDVCVPTTTAQRDWRDFVPPTEFEQDATAAEYVAFGWGDKGFYLDTPTWDDLTAKTAIKSMFWPTETAMHTSYYNRKPVASDRVKHLRISEADYANLIQFIESGFELDSASQTQLIDCCRYPGMNDNFYEGTGSYHCFKTCNVWTNNALKAAGVSAAVWSPFKEGFLYHID